MSKWATTTNAEARRFLCVDDMLAAIEALYKKHYPDGAPPEIEAVYRVDYLRDADGNPLPKWRITP